MRSLKQKFLIFFYCVSTACHPKRRVCRRSLCRLRIASHLGSPGGGQQRHFRSLEKLCLFSNAEVEQCPAWTPLRDQSCSFDLQKKNSHTSLMCKSFVYPFLHYAGARGLGALACYLRLSNMWRADPQSRMKEHTQNVALPEVRTFFSLLLLLPLRVSRSPFNSGRKVISASAAFEADPLGDTCRRGRGLLEQDNKAVVRCCACR